jgi:predicted nucleic acid-binding protein
MSAERATYLDASALVKLVTREPESVALRRFLRGKRALVASAIVRAEVSRAVIHLGPDRARKARDVVAGIELIRVSDRILTTAGGLQPAEMRTLDAIHLATAQVLDQELARVVTYDDRMATAATSLGMSVLSPQ